MKPEIASILIKFGKKEVSLTPDEARDLHDQLVKLFGPPPSPYPVVVWPTYVFPQPTYTPCFSGTEITCGDTMGLVNAGLTACEFTFRN